MTEIIIIVALLLLILAVVWGHFLNVKNIALSTEDHQRDEANVQLYYEHKAEIEKDYQQGRLDEENYLYLLAELDKSLLQDMSAPENAKLATVAKVKSFKIIWPLSLSLFVLVFSLTLYSSSGAYEQLMEPQASNESPLHGSSGVDENKVAALRALKTTTENEPENSNAWYSLGQAFVGMGEYQKALEAFDTVLSIEGEQADVIGAQAQAVYYANDQKITPEVQAYIDRALALDPSEASTNILLGMHNFMAKNYQLAIKHWQLVINSNKQNVNVEALSQVIDEAKNRLTLSGEELDNTAATQVDDGSPQLKLSIDLSEEIVERLSQGEDKTVFIYAIPTNGSRIPVAALKIRASDLPTDVVLDNSRAMSPQANLSSVEAVNVYAVVSNQGSVGMKSGDFKAEALNVDVNTSDVLTLTIDTVIP